MVALHPYLAPTFDESVRLCPAMLVAAIASSRSRTECGSVVKSGDSGGQTACGGWNREKRLEVDLIDAQPAAALPPPLLRQVQVTDPASRMRCIWRSSFSITLFF